MAKMYVSFYMIINKIKAIKSEGCLLVCDVKHVYIPG